MVELVLDRRLLISARFPRLGRSTTTLLLSMVNKISEFKLGSICHLSGGLTEHQVAHNKMRTTES